MPEPITPTVSDRICKHMNEDHADAVLLYAQHYGSSAEASAAVMDSIDADGMTLSATIDHQTVPVRVAFDHTLEGAEDAHHTLIDMLKRARRNA